ncbi:hypothetical protein C8Q76DRAFT_792792 [Earliella scabrosa]|nr:hypothetical protein C8Q76DRAFT_792792 [Earliella scabrosa]
MATYYTPFETETSAAHSNIIRSVLQDCITCNIMSHKLQGHYVVIRVSSLPIWRGLENIYYVLTTNIETKAASGIRVPVGRYPVPPIDTEIAGPVDDDQE